MFGVIWAGIECVIAIVVVAPWLISHVASWIPF